MSLYHGYMRMAEGILPPTFRARLVYVERDGALHLRPAIMQEALGEVSVMLASFLRASKLAKVCRHKVHRSVQCVVARDGIPPARGAIIYADDEGYSEVLLVDSGERIYAERRQLYHTVPVLSMTAALQIPCRLYGGYDVAGIGDIAEALYSACGTEPVDIRVRARNPLLVSIITEQHGDVGAYLERLAAPPPPPPRPLPPPGPLRRRRIIRRRGP